MPSRHIDSTGQKLGLGPFGWFPRLGSSPGPPWNAHRGADAARRSHTSGIRLSGPGATQGPKTPQWPTISELGNPKHSDNEALSLRRCSWLSAPTSLCPWGLRFTNGLCLGVRVQSSGAGKGHEEASIWSPFSCGPLGMGASSGLGCMRLGAGRYAPECKREKQRSGGSCAPLARAGPPPPCHPTLSAGWVLLQEPG